MSNICRDCNKLEQFEDIVSDTGLCDTCGHVKECCDFELLGLYRAFGIDNDTIWMKLPRLRNSNITGLSSVSLAAIGKAILSIHGGSDTAKKE